MRKQIYLSLFIVSIALPSLCFAEDQTITLKDGSQIKGTLTGVGNGAYTIHTAAMGDVKVSTANVATISNGLAAAPAAAMPSAPSNSASNSDFNQKIQSAQSTLMNDPEMMQQVTAMAQDPELMKLLSDPTLTQAVMSHDVNAIESNPKAKELMNNPKMRALMEQLKTKTSQ